MVPRLTRFSLQLVPHAMCTEAENRRSSGLRTQGFVLPAGQLAVYSLFVMLHLHLLWRDVVRRLGAGLVDLGGTFLAELVGLPRTGNYYQRRKSLSARMHRYC